MDSRPSTPKQSPSELVMLSPALERLVARNEMLNESSLVIPAQEISDKKLRSLDAFMATRAPIIALGRYLERIQRLVGLDPPCFIVVFVYIDPSVHVDPDLLVMSMNIHWLVLVCLMIASKVLDDMHHNNAFFARVEGTSNSEQNKLELELLFQLDFKVTIGLSVFERYYLHLEMEMLRNCANNKILKSTFNEFEKEVDSWENSLNRNGMHHSMSPSTHSFVG